MPHVELGDLHNFFFAREAKVKSCRASMSCIIALNTSGTCSHGRGHPAGILLCSLDDAVSVGIQRPHRPTPRCAPCIPAAWREGLHLCCISGTALCHVLRCSPHLLLPLTLNSVLGGFPTNASILRNYSADSSAFVVTLPLRSSPVDVPNATAWEAALVRLAGGRLSQMAASAGLRLSYSTERSVADELARESAADAPAVLASYLAMLLYIAVALGSFPPRPSRADVLVHRWAGCGDMTAAQDRDSCAAQCPFLESPGNSVE